MLIFLISFLYLFQSSLQACRREIWVSTRNICIKRKKIMYILNALEVQLDIEINEKIIDQGTNKEQKQVVYNDKLDFERIIYKQIDCITFLNFEFKGVLQNSEEPDNFTKPLNQFNSMTQYELNNRESYENECLYDNVEEKMVATDIIDCSVADKHFKLEKISLQKENKKNRQQNATFLNISLINAEKINHKLPDFAKKVSFNPKVTLWNYETISHSSKKCSEVQKIYLFKKSFIINKIDHSLLSFDEIDAKGNIISFNKKHKKKLILQKLYDALEAGMKNKYTSNLAVQDEKSSWVHDNNKQEVDSETHVLLDLKNDTFSYWYNPEGVTIFEKYLSDKKIEHKVFIFDPKFEIFIYTDNKDDTWVLDRVKTLLEIMKYSQQSSFLQLI